MACMNMLLILSCISILGRLKSSVEETNADGDIRLRRYHSNDRLIIKLLQSFYGTDIIEIIYQFTDGKN